MRNIAKMFGFALLSCVGLVGDCQIKRTGLLVPDQTRMWCSDIVSNPKREVQDASCLCLNGKWYPDIQTPPGSPITGEGKIRPAFFGNLVGHAKLLCSIVESIDCWQAELPRLPGIATANSSRDRANPQVLVRTPQNDRMLVDQNNIIDVIKQICAVIDEGVGVLPILLPDFDNDRPEGGLPWVLPLIIDKIIAGIGIVIDLVDLIGFFDIFTFVPRSNHSRFELVSVGR